MSSAEGGALRRVAVRSAGVMVFAQALGFAVQMVATVVLARMLLPGDFGVVAMVTTFSLLLVSFGQVGFPEAVVQREQIDHHLVSNLFWINLGASLVLTIAFAAAGSLLAKFYGDPRVAHVAIGVSLTIIVTATSVLHLALLKRAMRFSAVSVNDILARVVSVGVSIFLAWKGWGYWALIAGAIAQPLIASIGAWIQCPWLPSLPRRVAGTGSVVSFALHVNGRFSVDYFARNMDNLLVGWRFGPGPLGFYKKAYDLFSLPANQLLSVFPVVVSTLSRLNRDSSQYRRYLLGGLSVLALVGMAVGADLTLVGKDLVRLVLGPHWDEAGRLFMFFGPGIGVMLIYGTHGMIHLSIGTPGRWFFWGIIEFVVTGALFLVALPWGPAGIATAWTTSFWILIVPAFWYAGKPINFGIAPFVAALWKFAFASLLAGVACFLIVGRISWLVAAGGSLGALARIVSTSLVFTGLYILAIIVLHRGLAPLHQLTGILKEMAPWRKFTKPSPAAGATNAAEADPILAASVPGETI